MAEKLLLIDKDLRESYRARNRARLRLNRIALFNFLMFFILSLLINTNFISASQKYTLKVTEEHLFFVLNEINGIWKTAKELRIGEELLTADGKKAKVISLKNVDEGVEVYNLESAIYNDFVVSGDVVVHNSNTGEIFLYCKPGRTICGVYSSNSPAAQSIPISERIHLSTALRLMILDLVTIREESLILPGCKPKKFLISENPAAASRNLNVFLGIDPENPIKPSNWRGINVQQIGFFVIPFAEIEAIKALPRNQWKAAVSRLYSRICINDPATGASRTEALYYFDFSTNTIRIPAKIKIKRIVKGIEEEVILGASDPISFELIKLDAAAKIEEMLHAIQFTVKPGFFARLDEMTDEFIIWIQNNPAIPLELKSNLIQAQSIAESDIMAVFIANGEYEIVNDPSFINAYLSRRWFAIFYNCELRKKNPGLPLIQISLPRK